MSDEPSTSTSSSAAPPIYSDDFLDHQTPPPPPPQQQSRPGPSSNLTPSQISLRRKQNRQNFNKRRLHLLDDLIRGLDVLVYAELGVGYYLDCSTPLLILRCLIQFLYLTPKDPMFPGPPSGSRFLAIMLIFNIFCFAMHFWRGGPLGTVLDRGYLHGGLVLDFIGQEGGNSRWTLILLDLLVMGLQSVCCAVVRVRARVDNEERNGKVLEMNARRQRVEEEERGVRRSEEVIRRNEMEMERLNPQGTSMRDYARVATEEHEREQLQQQRGDLSILASTTAALERTDAHIFDAFNSGQIVVADLDLGRLVRDEWNVVEEVVAAEDDVVRRNRDIRQRLIERVRGRVGLRVSGPAATTSTREQV